MNPARTIKILACQNVDVCLRRQHFRCLTYVGDIDCWLVSGHVRLSAPPKVTDICQRISGSYVNVMKY